MKISLAKFICGGCHDAFEAPMLGESSYGEFLLWSSTGSVVYMNALEDHAYMEIKRMLGERYSELRNDPFAAANVLQGIFGPLACDPDSSGAPYMIGAQPVCKRCKAGKIESWELIYPPKIVDLDIPIVTHQIWDRMTDVEKVETLARSVVEFGSYLK